MWRRRYKRNNRCQVLDVFGKGLAAPWHIVDSNDKKRARLNVIAHILSRIPYKKIEREKVKLPARKEGKKYDDHATLKGRRFVEQKY